MDDKQTVTILKNVAIHLRDNEQGYRLAAEDVQDFDLKAEFRELCDKRAKAAERVEQLIRQYGGEPPAAEGSLMGQGFRSYMHLRTALTSNNRQAVLEEITRGEEIAEDIMDRAIRADLPPDARPLMKELHNDVRNVRNRWRQRAGMPNGAALHRTAAAVNTMVQERPVLSAAIAFIAVGVAVGALVAALSGGRSHGYAENRSWRSGGDDDGRQGGMEAGNQGASDYRYRYTG